MAFNWRHKLQLVGTYVKHWWKSLQGIKILNALLFPNLLEVAPPLQMGGEAEQPEDLDQSEVDRVNRLRTFCRTHGVAATLQRVFSNVQCEEDEFYLVHVLQDLFNVQDVRLELLLEYSVLGTVYWVRYRFPEHNAVAFPPIPSASSSNVPADIRPSVQSAQLYLTPDQFFDVTALVRCMAGPNEDFYAEHGLYFIFADLVEALGVPYSLVAGCELRIEDDMGGGHAFSDPASRLQLSF